MRTINYTVSYEKLISRLPALFAYVEIDLQNNTHIVSAINGRQGNYGQIVANLNCPYGFNYECEDGKKLLIKANKNYQYRTLIDTYYKALKDKKWDRNEDNTYSEPFLAFIERGIGLKYVGLSEELGEDDKCGVKSKIIYPLAPDYIYLGEAKGLYNKMIKMKKQVDFYKTHTKSCTDDKKYYVAIQEEFEMYNGEKLICVLADLIKEAEKISEEYYHLATNDLSMKFNVNLVNTIKDLGMVTPYIQEWIPGKRYYDGDAVYYVDDNGYGLTYVCKLTDENGKKKEHVKRDELGRLYTEGYYDLVSEVIYFEDKSLDKKDADVLWFPQYLNWVEENKCETAQSHKENYPSVTNEELEKHKPHNRFIEGEQDNILTIKGTVNSHLTGFRRFTSYHNRNDEAEYPEGFHDWLWYYRVGKIFNREDKSDTLGNLGLIVIEEDDNGTQFAKSVESIQRVENKEITDKELFVNGMPTNIVFDKDKETALNLSVWGDVITNITAINNNESGIGTITFEYILGAHLLAKKDKRTNATDGNGEPIKDGMSWWSKDDDGNYKYYFKDFTVDTTSEYGKNSGVKYIESYIYYKPDSEVKVIKEFGEYKSGEIISYDDYLKLGDNKKNCRLSEGSIWDLCENGKFDDYNNGKFDSDFRPLKIIKSFGDELVFKQGSLITNEEYSQLTSFNKNKCDVNSIIIASNVNLTLQFNVGDIVNSQVRDFLSTLNYGSHFQPHTALVLSPFDWKYNGKEKHYNQGDLIDRIEYYNLDKERQNKCEVIRYGVFEEFIGKIPFKKGDELPYEVYEDPLFNTYLRVSEKRYRAKENIEQYRYEKDSFINYSEYQLLSEADKSNVEDSLTEEDGQYYYMLYDKVEFDTSNNVHTYDFKFGTGVKKVPYLLSEFETKVDIRHIDIEDTPLIRYDYYNGVNFQPNVIGDVQIERGVTQAFEKHIKFSEIKTMEDLENYANGGFFAISKEDIDLG